jgi:hypothetical protein
MENEIGIGKLKLTLKFRKDSSRFEKGEHNTKKKSYNSPPFFSCRPFFEPSKSLFPFVYRLNHSDRNAGSFIQTLL